MGIGKLKTPIILGGGLTLGYAFLRHVLNWKVDQQQDFFDIPETQHVKKGEAEFDLPIMYYRDSSFLGVFGAEYHPITDTLPEGLHPVTLPNGQATIVIFALNYLDTSIGPYGEVGIAIPCTYHRSAPPLLPLLLEAKFPSLGMFVLHLPVTTQMARDAGRGVWGYPKFVADMDFEIRPAFQRIHLAEGGNHILTMTIRQQGLPVRDNRPLVTYSVLEKHLIRTTIPTRAVYQLGMLADFGRLELGTHTIAEQLKSFEISSEPVFTKNYLSRACLLPAGDKLDVVERSPTGFIGDERKFGRLTVSYAKGNLVDLHLGKMVAGVSE